MLEEWVPAYLPDVQAGAGMTTGLKGWIPAYLQQAGSLIGSGTSCTGMIARYHRNKGTMEDSCSELKAAEIDKTLIKAFLHLSPEKRIEANNRALQAITELRDAFKQAQESSS